MGKINWSSIKSSIDARLVRYTGRQANLWICIENFNKETWPKRDLAKHRYWAEQWRQADTTARETLFSQHGIRYTPLLRLPYFDPINFTVLDTMHNFFLGLLERHCRNIWGMDLEADDGDGSLKPYGTKDPPQVSSHKLQQARRALEFKDAKRLASSSKAVLIYLCIENDLRRASGKKGLIRELLQWRRKQGAYMPDRWYQSQATAAAREPQAPTPSVHPHGSLTPSAASSAMASGYTALPSTGNFQQQDRILLPSEISKDQIEDGQDILARGLKLDGITRPVLALLCAQRSIPLRTGALKKEMVVALNEWRAQQADAGKVQDGKRRKRGRSKADPGSVVLGQAVLTAASLDIQKMVLPRWVDPAPIGVGRKKRGKLSADQWRSFCTIHLVFTLIRLWGREPEESRWYKMLLNFLDLVQAVETGSMLVTSPRHRSAYETFMTRYLIQMKDLYKEAAIVPNHHLSLHVPDYLESWGPSPQTRGFGWERFNFSLQQINTNKRFGDIEKTYLFTSARKANLLALITLKKIRASVATMYQRLQKVVNPDARGTRLHDMLSTSSGVRCIPKIKVNLTPNSLESLATLLNSEEDFGVNYIPAHTTLVIESGSLFLHPLVSVLPSIKLFGTTYRPFSRAPRDSNVLICSGSVDGLPYLPARIEEIFTHERESTDMELKSEVFFSVRLLRALPQELVKKDWFRGFGLVGGSLWSTIYEGRSQIIRPSSIMCHFASSILEASATGFDCDATHILPLDRLKRQIESSGERIRDTYEDVEGFPTDDEDDQIEDEVEMEVDN
ncbi:hypothetical protein MD484_g8563, partial [Candolleomyces efflorescens]